jgi:hypothetical protein
MAIRGFPRQIFVANIKVEKENTIWPLLRNSFESSRRIVHRTDSLLASRAQASHGAHTEDSFLLEPATPTPTWKRSITSMRLHGRSVDCKWQ